MNGTGAEVPTKLKIFLVKSGNSIKKAGLADLEADVNEWLVDHPNITIDHTHTLGGPKSRLEPHRSCCLVHGLVGFGSEAPETYAQQ